MRNDSSRTPVEAREVQGTRDKGFLMRPLLAIVAVAVMAFSMPVMAQATLHDSSAFVGLLDLIRTSSNGWSMRLREFATSLFWSLALIQFVWTFGQLVLKQADYGELFAELIRYIMVIGFFASLLMYSTVWAEAIINSFRQAGASAAGVGVQLHPGDVFGMGVKFAETVSDVEMWNPVTATVAALASIIVLLCFTFIAAFMAITLAESYVVINASVIFMALGATQWTREYAISILRWSLSVGAKLFVLTLIIGLITESARHWQMAYRHDQASTLTLLGLALLCAIMSKTIPEYIQGLIQGVSPGGGSVIGGMAAAAAAGGVAGAAFVASKLGAANLLSGGSGSGGGIASAIGSSLFGGGGSAPSMMNSSGGTRSSGPSGSPSKLGGGAAPGPAPSSTSPKPSGTGGSGSKIGGMAHAAAAGAVKTAGVAASMAVPGMEGSESWSVGAPPAPPEMDISTPENIIRPAEGVAEAPVVDTMSSLKEALNEKGMRT